jgi:hypothetical protein
MIGKRGKSINKTVPNKSIAASWDGSTIGCSRYQQQFLLTNKAEQKFLTSTFSNKTKL